MESHLSFTIFAGKRLHLGVSGSVAGYKSLDLLRQWKDAGIDVGATLTASARQFLSPLLFEALGASPVFDAMYAASDTTGHFDDIFPHLLPGAAADAFVLVAASATTLARIAHGLGDEILSCQALAFPGPLVLAPAMNPRMWANAATQENWATLRRRGHILVEPAHGRVACMEEGGGRLADTREIYLAVLKALSPQDLHGKKVMVTMGPTREYWDGIRFWSNPSTGTMGAGLAVAAFLRGAEVHAVSGPAGPWLPAAIIRHDVVSAREMFEAANSLWDGMDVGVFTAAVADFSPKPFRTEKFKKDKALDGFSIEYTPNPDILQTLAARKQSHQRVVAFAAETSNVRESALEKLERKNADMIVANTVNVEDSGFGSGANTGFVADKRGGKELWPAMNKADMAWRILDWLSRL
ncbi:MAG: bifunctional phosphopantothenoylcysteine decarboxylase/phosphopantothenate--cysteine ligase CoaBC [Deltaproteobacteria bacterium]|nr:bifunctional phosphopantothenoylcysteine decarboxylase/phosphopantothenate--cysteine ligase CoaBC [Deltaproteobacteria bacterium]